MKHLAFLLFCFFSLTSCSNDEAVTKTVSPLKIESLSGQTQKWKLVKMTGSWTNTVTTGNDMTWQEFYIFNTDGSFYKSRTRDGATTEATGTFKYEQGKDANATIFYSLTYNTSTDLISSCFSKELSESLILNADNTLSGTWNLCDGPGLIYELVK